MVNAYKDILSNMWPAACCWPESYDWTLDAFQKMLLLTILVHCAGTSVNWSAPPSGQLSLCAVEASAFRVGQGDMVWLQEVAAGGCVAQGGWHEVTQVSNILKQHTPVFSLVCI